MAKKFDIKKTLGTPSTTLSVEAIEAMTRQIHQKTNDEKVENKIIATPIVEESPIAEPITVTTVGEEAIEETEASISKNEKNTEKSKRGRKAKPLANDERQIRISVDLPESVFIKLKVQVIQKKTDIKSYVRALIEKDLAKLD